MAERGIDLNGFRSRQVTADMALAADLILVMDGEQKKWCETLVPSARGRVQLLGRWLSSDQREIADPFRKSPEAFLHAFNLIQQSVTGWRHHLHGTEG
jgi:protein-tyrosine phosphatase